MEEFEVREPNVRFSVTDQGFKRTLVFGLNPKVIPWKRVISVSNKRRFGAFGTFMLRYNDGVKEKKIGFTYTWGRRPYYEKLTDLVVERMVQTDGEQDMQEEWVSAEKLIWQGNFSYAYGYPDPSKVSSPLLGVRGVHVTDDALVYVNREGAFGHGEYSEVFRIPRDAIKGVRHEQAAVDLWSSPDQFVIVVMLTEGREYEVRFKALGLTKQKDAFQFVDAVQGLLSRQ